MRLRTIFVVVLLVGCKRPTPVQAPEPASPPVSSPQVAPTSDLDGDGYVDTDDKCPDDPGVEPDGCPIPDADGDGILDPDDTCKTEPETRNGYLDEDGCPDEIPADLTAIVGTIKGVQFELDKAVLKRSSFAPLDRAVILLQKYPEIRIEVSGHTDSTGAPAYGRSPASDRARSVKRYLVEHGIDEARIETRGAGPDEPIDTNKTAVGRAKNRRIEFTILVQ
jgi:outer membrane protein OmpA-like peptidoglycan-associated protein